MKLLYCLVLICFFLSCSDNSEVKKIAEADSVKKTKVIENVYKDSLIVSTFYKEFSNWYQLNFDYYKSSGLYESNVENKQTSVEILKLIVESDLFSKSLVDSINAFEKTLNDSSMCNLPILIFRSVETFNVTAFMSGIIKAQDSGNKEISFQAYLHIAEEGDGIYPVKFCLIDENGWKLKSIEVIEGASKNEDF